MELPISQKELEKIIQVLKEKEKYKDLYSKLWTFNFNKNKEK